MNNIGRFTQTKQLVGGKWGTLYVVTDTTVEEILNLHNVTINIETESTTHNAAGKLWRGTKMSGLAGTGTMNIWYGSPFSLKSIEYFQQYKKTPDFDITCYNWDPDSGTGNQLLTIHNVQLQDLPIGLIDSDAGGMDQTINFVWERYTLTEHFTDADSTFLV